MKCDICREREATVFVQQRTDGGHMELRLCVPCAADHGLKDPAGDVAGVVEKFLAALPKAETPGPPSVLSCCPQCGLSQGDIKRRRSAGCTQCWELFADLLLDSHPGMPRARHKGRFSLGVQAAIEQEQKRKKLRDRLASAIALEAYEEASFLRDELRSLENKGSLDV